MARGDVLHRPDRRTALPLYQQIKEEIARRVHSGQWAPGRKLPSENELVASLRVSRMTIHRALRELTRDGVLVRVHGVGTFVAERRRHASLIELRDIADEVRAMGRNHHLVLHDLASVAASDAIAEAMALAPGAPVFHLVAVHYMDEEPVLYEDRHVNPALVPDFLAADFSRQTATAYLVDQVTPDEMEHVVQAVLPEPAVAAALKVGRGEPCLKLTRRTFRGESVVTRAILLYPGSRHALAARYATDDYRGR